MSAMRQSVSGSDPARSEDDGGTGVPPAPMRLVSSEADRVGADGAGNGSDDGGGDGTGDPAFDFFRQDAIRQGYVGPSGFAQYLKDYGILSASKQRRINEKEITGYDLDGSEPLDGDRISILSVTDSDLGN